MNTFFQNLFQLFFIVGYLLLFAISVIILKPSRKHRARPFSTISLKLSYLFFLGIFLIFTYLLLFGEKRLSENDIPFDSLFNIHFLIFLSSTITPNFGIMMRRNIYKYRTTYNIIFTVINLGYFCYLLFSIATDKWKLM